MLVQLDHISKADAVQYEAMHELYSELNFAEQQHCLAMDNGYSVRWSDFNTWYLDAERFNRDIRAIIKVVDDQIVGMLVYEFYGHDFSATVLMLYVKPTHRRRGYATELVERFMSESKYLMVSSISLTVMALNVDAMAFYAKFGFTPAITLLSHRGV